MYSTLYKYWKIRCKDFLNLEKTYAGHYSYDIHGNVKTLLQDNKKLYDLGVSNNSTTLQGQRYKRIDYDYDLISGKVNLVRYQDGKPDAFYHFYEYDADNRITNVYTSKYPQANAIINSRVVEGNQLWEQDAKYFYYAHGPLARAEIGNDKSQGMDYAYTLQGWIKGVNSNTLDKSRDIGQDGLIASINSGAAKDAFGYTLNYHANDYSAIQGLRWNNATDRFETVTAGSDLTASSDDLFNGNITSMVTTIEQPMVYTSTLNQAPNVLPQGTAYKYDQLNRLKETKAFSNLNIPTNIWQSGSTYSGMYNNKFNFDANGNITYQERADGSGMMFDKMNYKYKLDGNGKIIQNRLYHVNDLALTTAAIDDIDDQGTFNSNPLTANDGVTNNHQYDEIGNLKKDKQEQILRIDWTVYGKIKSIIRTSTSTKSDLEFNYDASGNRISKTEKPHGSSIENGGANNTGLWTTTYYTRDAQGNIMTTYKFALPGGTASFKAIERNLFGSSRLGTDNTEVELVGVLPTANPFTRTLGNKHFEGSNHLGNVLVIFTDKKMPVTTNGTTIDHFDGDVENTFDYTPFGAPMNERSYRLVMKKGPTYSINPNDKFPAFVNGNEPLANIASENPKYRYGFNGMEKDDEVKGNGNCLDFETRIYDPRLGRFLSIDPLFRSYPWYTPYLFAGNNPIAFIDVDGLGEEKPEIKKNVMIVIVSADEIKANKLKGGDMGTFYTIVATDAVSANQQFQKYTGGQKVDNLVIRTHGGSSKKGTHGSLDIDPDKPGLFGSEVFSAHNKGTLQGDLEKQVQALDKILGGVADGGTCVFSACEAGADIKGAQLAEELRTLTDDKTTMYLNQDVSTRATSEGNTQIYMGEGGGITAPADLKEGFIKTAPEQTTVPVKGSNNSKTGNISIDSRAKSKDAPITETKIKK